MTMRRTDGQKSATKHEVCIVRVLSSSHTFPNVLCTCTCASHSFHFFILPPYILWDPFTTAKSPSLSRAINSHLVSAMFGGAYPIYLIYPSLFFIHSFLTFSFFCYLRTILLLFIHRILSTLIPFGLLLIRSTLLNLYHGGYGDDSEYIIITGIYGKFSKTALYNFYKIVVISHDSDMLY
jgi:hypothetical protein